MDVESSICLSDLVPALRWSRPQQVAEALSDPRLPSAWWSSMPLQRAFAATGLDWVCERLALLASSRWDHLPLGDVLPAMALHPIDPTLPGYPEPARTAIVGLGGWHRLRRLTPADLKAPGSTPETVMGTVFREVLGRLAARPEAVAGHPEVTRPVQRGASGTGSFPAAGERPAAAFEGTGAFAGPNGGPAKGEPLPQRADERRNTGAFPAPADERRNTGSFPRVGDDARPGGEPRRPAASFPAEEQRSPGSFPGDSRRAPGSFPGDPQRSQSSSPDEGRRSTGSFPAVGRDQRSTGSFPAVGRDQRSTGSFPAVGGGQSPLPQRPAAADSSGPHTGSLPSLPGGSASYGSQPAPVPSDTDHAMVRVVDSLFRGLNKLELAVAEHRLFAEDPVSLRTLAHKMLVEREILSQAQRTAEERVLTWLRSSESAPITGHMFRLTEWLGAAATEDQLIGADPAHPATVPSLRTPLWRVLVTLMPDRRLQDGWLVVGDIQGLQARTRRLLASAQPDADMVELMAELGIRAHSAKAWLDALPPEQVHDPVAASDGPPQPLPRRTPGANGHHHRGGQPIPAAAANSIDPSAALATLSALSNGRSPMLQGHLAGTPATPPPPPPSPSSDPRRWQRIEVKPEHLRGGPVPVPQNYAAQLGMRPGTLLSVTGPGDNAIVLVWQGQQPVFDSLQPVLMRLNARPGDQVYVTVDGYRLEAQLTG
ncbi:hypothetical protein [Nonomuraea sp. C10]|uniref:hypothetical protein n=1 Tax=Nonomuraea sp. C10 TaxID=2600577 RepID=UPI0011CE3609|nr:hypothetical protein [Nonomuraea sp. C10]TXK39750.1 hypothetical protein FR742_09235 [Nonomuraea sp. C10]